MEMAAVIAFDAATTTGYAYRLGKHWVTGTLRPLDQKEELDRVIQTAASKGVVAAAIEEPYCGKNVRTMRVLAQVVDRIEFVCEQHGLVSEKWRAQEWQSQLQLDGPREERKLGAKCIARNLGARPATEDEADAVCLAYVAESRVRLTDLASRMK